MIEFFRNRFKGCKKSTIEIYLSSCLICILGFILYIPHFIFPEVYFCLSLFGIGIGIHIIIGIMVFSKLIWFLSEKLHDGVTK